MALPDVTVLYQSGGLGRVAPAADRVVGLIANGYSDAVAPFVVFSYEDFLEKAPAGLLADMSQPHNVFIALQVADFYSEAAPGSELWIKTTAQERTLAELFGAAGKVQELLDAAEGRINVVGVSRFKTGETSSTAAIADGLAGDIISAIDEAYAQAEANAAQHQPVRFLLDGKFLHPELTGLRDLTTHTFNRVGICVGSNRLAYKNNAAIGLLLGRVAATAVNVNPGRVKDKEVPTSEAYITNGVTVKAAKAAAIVLEQKGYIFLRKFPNKAGYFWVGGHMAAANTDDCFSLEFGRVIDKIARIAYATFLEELMDTVQVDAQTGKLAKTVVKNYQSRIERAIGLGMVAKGELSGIEAFIDPNQDILATSELMVELRAIPTGLTRDIFIKLGFTNPNV